MYKTEQGVRQHNKLIRLLVHLLLLSIFCLTQKVFAQSLDTKDPAQIATTQKHHAYVIYSPDNTLHSNIVKQLAQDLKRSNIVISTMTPQEKTKIANPARDIIISIGHAGIQSANEHYPKTKKLFIAIDPNNYRMDTKGNNAILYMTQPYCRQIKFIRQLNAHWKTIGILSSRKKPVDRKPIQQCAKKYGFKIYTVTTSPEKNLTNEIKSALKNSDVLLALPDSSIYNSRTVKNILLTSYRYRKPVIAFSKNFVNAGALASIHSNTRQIADSASKILEKYFDTGSRFQASVNYPDSFETNINKQVFRALDIPIPDMESLNESLQNTAEDSAGDSP